MEAIHPRKKFSITNYTPPYEPTQRTKPCFQLISKYDSDVLSTHSNSHELFITSNAIEQIFSHIGWGRRIEYNSVEQGGILLGQVFRDEDEKLTYGIVETAIAGSSAKGSSVSLEMTHETWKQMLDSVEDILNRNPQKNLQVIGWYHTHPNDLSVFMSGVDQSTQSRLFFHDWQFAVVMNPHKKIWRAFYGMNANECRGFVIQAIQDSETDYLPQKSPHTPNEQEEKLTEKATRKAKIERQKRNLTNLKNFLSRSWRSVKIRFRIKPKDKKSAENQAQGLPNQNGRLLKNVIGKSKINLFLWFYSFMLLSILVLQIVNLYLQLSSRKK